MPSFQYLPGSVSLHYVHTVRVLNNAYDHTRHALMHTTLLYKVLEKLTMLLTLGWVNFKASCQYSLYVFLRCYHLLLNVIGYLDK